MQPPVDIQDVAASVTSALFLAAVSPTPESDPAAAAAVGDDGGDEDEGECRLLGPFALIVQLALGALALLVLVYKRWRERPQRPVKIWFFDVSKQVFGSVLVHIANVFMSMLTSGRFSIKVEPGPTARMLMGRDDDPYVPNPCSFYLLNLGIDTTLGIPILIVLLRVTTGLVSYTPLGKPAESIQSGYYGNPPSVWWWLKQSFIYFVGLFGMKICVLIIFLAIPDISKVGDWALRWTEGNEKLQIAFVMMIFPVIMNALQYYIIDSFIKKKEPLDHERLPSEDPDEAHGRSPYGDGDQLGQELLTGTDSDSEDDRHISASTKNRVNNKQIRAEAYDPEVDGDARTVVGSSTSGGGIPRELLPKE